MKGWGLRKNFYILFTQKNFAGTKSPIRARAEFATKMWDASSRHDLCVPVGSVIIPGVKSVILTDRLDIPIL
jgi:hypothetical protein